MTSRATGSPKTASGDLFPESLCETRHIADLLNQLEAIRSALLLEGAFRCGCFQWVTNGEWYCQRCGLPHLTRPGWAWIGGVPMLRENIEHHLWWLTWTEHCFWLRETRPEMMDAYWGPLAQVHIGADGWLNLGAAP